VTRAQADSPDAVPPGSPWHRYHRGAPPPTEAAPTPALNGFAATMFTLGARAFLANEMGQAETLFRLALGASGNDFAALGLLALIDIERRDFAAAEGWLRAALALQPDEPATLNNLGEALRQLDRLDEAVACYRRALARSPDYASAHDNLGTALVMANRPAEALAHHRRAIALRQDHPESRARLGVALMSLNRYQDALPFLHRAGDRTPEVAQARLHEAYALLAMGRLEEGWAAYEARWDTLYNGSPIVQRHTSRPRWTGETSPRGRTLLLHHEQGLGDTLHFVRYAPLLARQGATVLVEAQPSLVPLLGAMRDVTRVLASGEEPPPFELQCPLLSLPLACRTTLRTVPAEVPYLTVPPDRLPGWRRWLGPGDGRRRIAIAWSGNPEFGMDRQRSIPLRLLEPLLARRDCEFHIAQPRLTGADRAVLDRMPLVIDHSGALGDFADTAALLAHMDLVISVDTAVAHLAGALARPTWLLLAFSAEWRWLVGREDSPWYPTMRLFRQPAPGCWEAAIAAVARALDRPRDGDAGPA
jgi:tetratricopeptide (TPR) repeat protein